MAKNLKSMEIIKIISLLMITMGIILIVPLVASFAYGERGSEAAFVLPSVISFAAGGVGYMTTRRYQVKLDMAWSMLLCFAAWLVASLVGAVPFMIALDKSFIDALFESASGFTTTGATVLTGIEHLPRTIQIWRCLTQWVGGIGILTFFLLITYKSESDLWYLFDAETHKTRFKRPVPNVYSTVRILWAIYIGLTVVLALVLPLFGVSMYDSILHSLTTIATGGFSPYDQSVLQFSMAEGVNYRAVEYTLIFFMFISGINFLLHYQLFTSGPEEYGKSHEFNLYAGIIAFFTLVIFAECAFVIRPEGAGIEDMFRASLFQVVSLITSTGFTTEYIGSDYFGHAAKQLFLVLMLVGGCVGSTSGGLKVIRLAILGKLFLREIKKLAAPKSAVLPVTIDRLPVGSEEIFRVSAILFGWIGIIFVGSLITSFFSGLDMAESISGMLSMVGNMGPTFFDVETMASLSPVIKLTYIVGMISGRLEILPIFILVSMRYRL